MNLLICRYKLHDKLNCLKQHHFVILLQLFAKMNNFTFVDDFLEQFNTSQYATSYAEDLGLTRANVSSIYYNNFITENQIYGFNLVINNERNVLWHHVDLFATLL